MSRNFLSRNIHSFSLPDLTSCLIPAILRETSNGTSYQIVRWIFRPFCHVWKAICTSAFLRTSTRISSGFILHNKSSPSFGSDWKKFVYPKQKVIEKPQVFMLFLPLIRFLFEFDFFFTSFSFFSNQLLSPCFKTGGQETGIQINLNSTKNVCSYLKPPATLKRTINVLWARKTWRI